MIWLQSPQWIRWTAAFLIAAIAIWAEFGPEGAVDHAFAVEDIAPGEAITDANTELRRVPKDLLERVPATGYARVRIYTGQPLQQAMVSLDPIETRSGWWSLEVAVPHGANLGDAVWLVLVETGQVVSGVVSALPSVDPLGSDRGAVALPPEDAAAAAVASANGQVVVLVSGS